MSQEIINYGAAPNDGTGDPLRVAFIKTDNNFDQIWATGPVGSNITILNNTIQVTNTNGNLELATNGTGVISTRNHVRPGVSQVYDIGSANLRYRTGYFTGLNIDGNVTITGNLSAGNISYTSNVFVGDLKGSVFADDSTIMVDAIDNVLRAGAIYTDDYFYANGSPYGVPTGNNGAVQINWLEGFSNQGGTPGDTYSTMQFDSDGLLNVNGTTAYQPRVDYTSYVTVNTPRVESTDFDIVAGPGITVVGYDDNYNTPRSAYMSVQDQANATQQWDFGILGNGSNDFSVRNRTASTIPLVISTDGTVTASTIITNNISSDDSSFVTIQDGLNVIGDIETRGNVTADYFLGNGSQLTGISTADTGNVTFDDVNIIGDGNLRLQPDPANASAYLDIFLTGGAGPDIHIAGNGENVILGRDTGANVAVNVDGKVSIQSDAGTPYTWTFEYDGNLTLPRGGIVYETNIPGGVLSGNTIALTPQGGTSTDQQLLIYPTADPTADANHLHLTSGNLYNTELFLGNDNLYVKLANTGNVVINSNDNVGNSAQWTFDTTGRVVNLEGLTLTAGGQFNICTILTGGSGYGGGGSFSATTGGSGTGLTVAYGYGLSGQVVNASVINPGDGNYQDGDVITMTAGNGAATFRLTQYNVLGNQGNNNFVESNWTFGAAGETIFPTLTTQRGDNPSGTISGQTLLFGNATQEAIISTPDGVLGINGDSSQRLVINPGEGYQGGEGGDIYLWAGRGGNASGSGGDIKIRGGQGGANTVGGAGGSGGYIRMEAGDAATTGGNPGYIDITGGYSNTVGGYVNVTGGQGNTIGGDVKIYGGYGTATGGNVNIWGGASGNGQANEGHVNIETGGNTWVFGASGNLAAPGNISATGNVTGAYIKGNGSELTNLPAPVVTQDITSNGAMSIMTYDGVIKYVNYATVEPSSGNITGGNILTNGLISATGNVTGNYFIGNGSQLTGLPATYGNANVVANLAALGSNPISSTGNITTTANVSGNFFIGNGSQLTGIAASYGNANVATFLAAYGSNTISTTGNITAGNLIGNISITGNVQGTSANVTLVAGSYNWTFNNTGNLTLPGNTFAVNYANNTPVDAVTRFSSTWTVPTGNSTQSFTVGINETYQMWVDCNIPNGILVWNATATVTNTNVPVVGYQYAWVYNGGGTPIDFTSIPNQFVGTANAIVRSNTAPSATTNRFDFGINNTSGSAQTVRYGWIAIS